MFQKSFKTVVVGVDFSPYSKIVVRQARLLCEMWGAQLVLVHAIHDPVVYTPSLYMAFPNLLDDQYYADRIRKYYDLLSIEVKCVATRGLPAALLRETAAKVPQPLIMAGHRGQSKISDFFFGSTAQVLALKSKTPVWIHRGHKVIRPERVLIPHDLSLESNHSIDILKKLSLTSPLTYEVFFVHEKPFPVLDYKAYKKSEETQYRNTQLKIRNLLKAYPHLPFVTAQGDVTDKIVKRTRNFDLLVMAHHNPTGLFSKSETAELIRKVKTPILVTH